MDPRLLAGVARGRVMKTAARVGLLPSRLVAAGLRKAALKTLVVPVVGAFGAGLALGAGLGVLLAPTSGEKLRAKIGARVSGLVKRAQPGAS